MGKKRVFKNILWMTFDKVFLLLLSLFVTVKVVNYFGADEYGTYQYAVSVVALLEIIVNIVDGRVVKKRYVDEKYSHSEIVFNSSMCRVFCAIISFIIGLIVIVFSNKGNEFALILMIMLFSMILSNLKFGMANRFQFMLESKRIVIASDVSALITSLLQLFIITHNGTIVHIAVIAGIASIVDLSIIIIQYKIEFPEKIIKAPNYELMFELMKESLPLALATACAIIYQKCDSIMIGNLLSTKDVGIYSISLKLISIVQIANGPIRESVYPKLIELYKMDKKRYSTLYIKVTSILTWICISGVAFSYLVLPYLFKFLNEEYMLALPIYKIYVVGTLFMYNASLRAGHYTLINRGQILTYSQIISVFINLILNLILIKNFGVYGAAISTALTQAISLWFSNLFFGQDGRTVFIWQLKAFNPFYVFSKI